MIVLDTNVVSAAISAVRIPHVVEWLNRQQRRELWIGAVTLFELRLGIECLKEGRKRRELERASREMVSRFLSNRVLPFDISAAQHAGIIYANGQRTGRTIEIRDAQIAGTVMAAGGVLATHDIDDFSGTGIKLIDPWSVR